MRFPRILAVAVALALALPTLLFARSWTDRNGKRMEAMLVRVQNDVVTLSSKGKTATFPIAGFSDADQAYLRTKMPKTAPPTATGSQVASAIVTAAVPPTAKAVAPAQVPKVPAAERKTHSAEKSEGEVNLLAPRVWSDVTGRKVRAGYVRMEDSNVVLRTTRRMHMVPFQKFCKEDQNFLREQLAARGEAHLLPAEKVAAAPAQSVRDTSAVAAVTIPGASDWGRPKGAAADSDWGRAERQNGLARQFEPQARVAPGSSANAWPGTASSSPASAPAGQPATSAQVAVAPVASYSPPASASPSSERTSGFADMYHRLRLAPTEPPRIEFKTIAKFKCSKCREEVPASVKAGDCCPHCGAYFESAQDEHGVEHHAIPGTTKGWWIAMWPTLVAFVVAALIRAARSSR